MINYDQPGNYETWVGSEDLRGGSYRIANGLHFGLKYKPNRFHRFMCKLLLGWDWVPNVRANESR